MTFDYVFANPPYFTKNADSINRMCLAVSRKAVILNTKLSFRTLYKRFAIYYIGFFGCDADQRVYIGVSGGRSRLVMRYKHQDCDKESLPPVERSVIVPFAINAARRYRHEGKSTEALWNRENITREIGGAYKYILFDTEKEKQDFIAELEKSDDKDRFMYFAFGGWYEIEKAA